MLTTTPCRGGIDICSCSSRKPQSLLSGSTKASVWWVQTDRGTLNGSTGWFAPGSPPPWSFQFGHKSLGQVFPKNLEKFAGFLQTKAFRFGPRSREAPRVEMEHNGKCVSLHPCSETGHRATGEGWSSLWRFLFHCTSVTLDVTLDRALKNILKSKLC